MSWIEGSANSNVLIQTVLKEIQKSGHGWDIIPSFNSQNTYVTHTTRDGTVLKKNVYGNDIALGFHQITNAESAMCLIIHLYTDFKASSTLDKLGTYTSRKTHSLMLGRWTDGGVQLEKVGYGIRYKISVTDERVIMALKFEQSLDNSWVIYSFGAIRDTSNKVYNNSAYAVFTSWAIATTDYYELMLYHNGDKYPQQVLGQGIYNLSNNGTINSSELVSPIKVKNVNGGFEGLLDIYVSISENAFREGDEVYIDGRLYTAVNAQMYPPSLYHRFHNSLMYAHVTKCSVLIPKE